MAGDFTKRTEENRNIWTCNNCSEDIVIQSKPRNHVCRNLEEASRPEGKYTGNPRPGDA